MDPNELKRLRVSFNSMQEIEGLRSGKSSEIVRSSLGVVKQKEDWIFNLNITNVMKLQLLNSDELSSTLSAKGLKDPVFNEVGRDSMLEKIVRISVAYFCQATEMRFLAKLNTEENPKESQQYKDSEAYHAKAVHIAV